MTYWWKNLMEFFWNNQAHKFGVKFVEIIGLNNFVEKQVDNLLTNWEKHLVKHS